MSFTLGSNALYEKYHYGFDGLEWLFHLAQGRTDVPTISYIHEYTRQHRYDHTQKGEVLNWLSKTKGLIYSWDKEKLIPIIPRDAINVESVSSYSNLNNIASSITFDISEESREGSNLTFTPETIINEPDRLAQYDEFNSDFRESITLVED